jgi:hypothetical protein
MPRSNGPKALPPEGKGAPPEHRATTSRLMWEASVDTGRTRDGTPAAPDCLGDEQHHRNRRARLDERVRRGYHPRREGRYRHSRETTPELWLADYRLACHLGGTDDDNLVILNLPLFLSDAARAWLEHLPPAQISNWDDLVKAFAGNFQGTYVGPGNSWDLRSCR